MWTVHAAEATSMSWSRPHLGVGLCGGHSKENKLALCVTVISWCYPFLTFFVVFNFFLKFLEKANLNLERLKIMQCSFGCGRNKFGPLYHFGHQDKADSKVKLYMYIAGPQKILLHKMHLKRSVVLFFLMQNKHKFYFTKKLYFTFTWTYL